MASSITSSSRPGSPQLRSKSPEQRQTGRPSSPASGLGQGKEQKGRGHGDTESYERTGGLPASEPKQAVANSSNIGVKRDRSPTTPPDSSEAKKLLTDARSQPFDIIAAPSGRVASGFALHAHESRQPAASKQSSATSGAARQDLHTAAPSVGRQATQSNSEKTASKFKERAEQVASQRSAVSSQNATSVQPLGMSEHIAESSKVSTERASVGTRGDHDARAVHNKDDANSQRSKLDDRPLTVIMEEVQAAKSKVEERLKKANEPQSRSEAQSAIDERHERVADMYKMPQAMRPLSVHNWFTQGEKFSPPAFWRPGDPHLDAKARIYAKGDSSKVPVERVRYAVDSVEAANRTSSNQSPIHIYLADRAPSDLDSGHVAGHEAKYSTSRRMLTVTGPDGHMVTASRMSPEPGLRKLQTMQDRDISTEENELNMGEKNER